jgi:hypothetical protein
MSLFLTPEEIADLTGYKMQACQAKWLRSNGFVFRVSADNRVILARDHVLMLMGPSRPLPRCQGQSRTFHGWGRRSADTCKPPLTAPALSRGFLFL